MFVSMTRFLNRRQGLFWVLAGMLALPAGAIAGELPSPLTLEQCVEIALAENPSQRAAQAGIEAAHEAVGLAGAPYYPHLDATAGYRRWDTHVFLPSGVGQPGLSVDTLGATDDWHGALEASYLLFDSGRRRAELEAARMNLGATGSDAERTRQEIVLLVHEAFNGLLAAGESKAAAATSLGRSEEHLRLARLRKEAGDVPQADVIRAQTEVANARLRLVRTESEERMARANLNAAMGLPAHLPLAIAGKGSPELSPEEIDPEQAAQSALRQRPEMAAAERRLQASRLQVEAVRGAYRPKIQADAKYGFRDTDFLPEDEDWAIGISLRVPLFTGFARTHEVARESAEVNRQQAQMAQVALSLQQEVATAYAALLEAHQAALTTEVLLTDATEGLRLTTARYEAGAGTINDLLDAEAALANAEGDRVRANYQQQIAAARFRRSVGEL